LFNVFPFPLPMPFPCALFVARPAKQPKIFVFRAAAFTEWHDVVDVKIIGARQGNAANLAALVAL
jgi:hypothetical protein